MPSLGCSFHCLHGALWLLLPSDQFPKVFTQHILRFLGLPGYFLSPDKELKMRGHWQQESSIFQVLFPNGFPLSCFPCRTIEKRWATSSGNTQTVGAEPAAPRKWMIPTACPAEETAMGMLTASTFHTPTTGQALSKLDHTVLHSRKAQLG